MIPIPAQSHLSGERVYQERRNGGIDHRSKFKGPTVTLVSDGALADEGLVQDSNHQLRLVVPSGSGANSVTRGAE
jgi:hypothetical protein